MLKFDTANIIENLQIETGLQNVGGSVEIYRKVLKSFYTQIGDFAKELENYASLDIETLRQRIHAIKGSAANIGAAALYEKAKVLESAITENDSSFVNDSMPVFLNQLNSVLAAISVYLSETSAAPAAIHHQASQIDKQNIPVFASMLLKAVEDMDNDEIYHYTKNLRDCNPDESFQAALNDIEAELDNLEYEAAAKLIKNIISATDRQLPS